MRHELYNAGVAFYEILVRKLKKGEQLEIELPSYFGKSKLTYKLSKHFLKTAKETHNRVLKDKGPYGNLHRCNEYPFSFNKSETSSYKDMKNTPIHYDHAQLFTSNYTSNYKSIEKYDLENPRASLHQCDLLCNGKHTMVM